MGTLFKGWRRKSGIVSLILAFVFAGAWVKSSFDETVMCFPNGNRVDELSMAGKIGVFCHPINVEITGLYRDSFVLNLPHRPDTESARPTPPREGVDFSLEVRPPSGMIEDAKVALVSYQTEEGDDEEDSSSSVPQNQSDAKPPQGEKRIGLTFDLEKQVMGDSLGNTWKMDSETAKELAEQEDHDEGLTTSKWQALGFYANWTKSRDGVSITSFLVPHGAIVIPLVLLSLILLFNPSTFQRAKSPVLS